MANGLEEAEIAWHPGFYGAAEIELIFNKSDLEFHREYNLSKEPIRMDLLIIKKLTDAKIKNEIGHIFKKYNVVEYLSDLFYYPYFFYHGIMHRNCKENLRIRFFLLLT